MIALMTDFGTQDTYVGVMKGVMSRIDPTASFVDITHAIQPQRIKQAAVALKNAYSYFPVGTVFLVVIDPGVGSTRKPIAVKAGGYYFIAPDNGVLSYALAQIDEAPQIVHLSKAEFQLVAVSNTFHGRDIFAPAAAYLHKNVPMSELGESLASLNKLSAPRLVITERQIEGEVIHIDHFGNVITSIGELKWQDANSLLLSSSFSTEIQEVSISARVSVTIKSHHFETIQPNYATVSQDDTLVLIGSDGYLELAVNQGNAAQRYDVNIGDNVLMAW